MCGRGIDRHRLKCPFLFQVLNHAPAIFPGADNQASHFLPSSQPLLLDQEDPVREANDGEEKELQQRTNQVVRPRHPSVEDGRAEDVEESG